MITLYHSAGTRSMRCVWLLEELGLDYELKCVDFPPRVKAPDFLAVNPLGSLPFLIDGDVKMNESCAILQYLSAKYGDGELELGAADDHFADYLNWLHFGECSLAMLQSIVLRYRFFLPKDQRQPAVAQDYQVMVDERLAVLSQALSDHTNDYLCGKRFSLADISVGYALVLMSHFKLDQGFSSELRAYLNRLSSRPAFQRATTK